LHEADESTRKESEEEVKKQAGTRAKDSKPSLGLDKYAGKYEDAWYGQRLFDWKNGKLIFSLDHTATRCWGSGALAITTRSRRGWRDRTVEDAFCVRSV